MTNDYNIKYTNGQQHLHLKSKMDFERAYEEARD